MWLKHNQSKNNIVWHVKIIWHSNCISINKVVLGHSHVHLVAYCLCAIFPTRQSGVVATEILWLAKPKIFTIWPSRGKLCWIHFLIIKLKREFSNLPQATLKIGGETKIKPTLIDSRGQTLTTIHRCYNSEHKWNSVNLIQKVNHILMMLWSYFLSWSLQIDSAEGDCFHFWKWCAAKIYKPFALLTSAWWSEVLVRFQVEWLSTHML